MRFTKHLANVFRPHSSNIASFYFAVKQSNNNKIQELESDHAADISRCDRELEHRAQQLADSKQKMEHERMQFQSKLDELELVSDQRYCETRNARHSVQDQINRARINEHKLQNYIDALKDSQSSNDNSIRDLKNALSKVRQDNRASKRQLANAKQLAADRLEKWHQEREQRREAENAHARTEKTLEDTKRTLNAHIHDINQSQDKRKMKKEWASEAKRSKRGGKRQWPVWVVQLICELLICGTPPASIPDSIQIMYETLYGEPPDERPSINCVRQCRVVVEVIGETLVAMKLADASKWDQLWTDATTRRQIPFTALIIGMLDEDGKIDPVVVSSCIFMDDETAETQSAGIVNKVSALIIFLNCRPEDRLMFLFPD